MRLLILIVMALALLIGMTTLASAKTLDLFADGLGAGGFADDDGDGIPNCEDPDYVPPLDGTGYRYGYFAQDFGIYIGHLLMNVRGSVVTHYGVGEGPKGWAYGPGDGTGNDVRPEDGTGFGPGGDGICQ